MMMMARRLKIMMMMTKRLKLMMIVMMRIKNPLETMNYKIMLMMMLIMMTRLKIMIMIMMVMITGLMMTLLDRIYKSVVDTMKRQGWFAEELFHYLGKEKERERGVAHFLVRIKDRLVRIRHVNTVVQYVL